MALPPGADPDLEHEELEIIPWAMLAEHMGQRRMLGYGRYALGLLVFALVVVVGLNVARQRPGTVVAADPDTTDVASSVPTTPVAQLVTTTIARAGVPSGPALYSEADLMAVLPDTIDDAGAARRRATQAAEWFVTDYFTSTGVGPQTSWVEWTLAGDVVAVTASDFEVVVAFGTLVADDEGTYRRSRDRAVILPVRVEDDTATVVGLPRPAVFADMFAVDLPSPPVREVPEGVAAVAREQALGVGTEPQVLGGSERDDGSWRVLVDVSDEVGARWTVAVVIEM